jgi:small subunit ribosomal protein S2
MSTDVSIKELFEAGAHFGHKTSRWHPKMAPYLHSAKDGVHIINLEKTVDMLDQAVKFVSETAKTGKQILFVGTKRQAKEIVFKMAEEVGMPYITVRWFGGLLTNHKTMGQRVKHLKNLEKRMESGELASRYSKLEVQRFQEEIDQLQYNFGGVKEMSGLPGALFVTDVVVDQIAVKEANRLGIPIVGIVDSNANPDLIDYPIPANDDAIKCLTLITSVIRDAVKDGKAQVKIASKENPKPIQASKGQKTDSVKAQLEESDKTTPDNTKLEASAKSQKMANKLKKPQVKDRATDTKGE